MVLQAEMHGLPVKVEPEVIERREALITGSADLSINETHLHLADQAIGQQEPRSFFEPIISK